MGVSNQPMIPDPPADSRSEHNAKWGFSGAMGPALPAETAMRALDFSAQCEALLAAARVSHPSWAPCSEKFVASCKPAESPGSPVQTTLGEAAAEARRRRRRCARFGAGDRARSTPPLGASIRGAVRSATRVCRQLVGAHHRRPGLVMHRDCCGVNFGRQCGADRYGLFALPGSWTNRPGLMPSPTRAGGDDAEAGVLRTPRRAIATDMCAPPLLRRAPPAHTRCREH